MLRHVRMLYWDTSKYWNISDWYLNYHWSGMSPSALRVRVCYQLLKRGLATEEKGLFSIKWDLVILLFSIEWYLLKNMVFFLSSEILLFSIKWDLVVLLFFIEWYFSKDGVFFYQMGSSRAWDTFVFCQVRCCCWFEVQTLNTKVLIL